MRICIHIYIHTDTHTSCICIYGNIYMAFSLGEMHDDDPRDAQMRMYIYKDGQMLQGTSRCVQHALPGATITLHYSAWFWSYNQRGQLFDASHAPGKPALTVKLDKDSLPDGWENCLYNICQGEKRAFILPPMNNIGFKYGPQPVPFTDLLFYVHALHIRAAPPTPVPLPTQHPTQSPNHVYNPDCDMDCDDDRNF